MLLLHNPKDNCDYCLKNFPVSGKYLFKFMVQCFHVQIHLKGEYTDEKQASGLAAEVRQLKLSYGDDESNAGPIRHRQRERGLIVF